MGKSGMRDVITFIKAEMDRQGLSQNELAERCGMQSGTVSRILNPPNDDRGVELASIDKLAHGLGYGLISFLMVAAQSISGFQDVDLIETYQQLTPEARVLALEFVRMLAERSGRETEQPRAEKRGPDPGGHR